MRYSLLALLLSAVGCVTSPHHVGSPAIEARYTSTPPTIDGNLNEQAWIAAAPTVLRFDLTDASDIGYAGEARFLYDAQHLYVAMKSPDRDLFGMTAARDEAVYREDALELFIRPNPASRVYYELEFSPTGQTFDARWPSRSMINAAHHHYASWNSRMIWAVQLRGTLNQWQDEDEGWQVEIAIPWTDFVDAQVGPPVAGDVWHVTVGRYDYSSYREKPQLTSTAPLTLAVGFHEYEKYNTLTFIRESR